MSIKILIIEDEQSAVKHLINLLKVVEQETKVLATLPTVTQAVHWLKNNREPDVILCDIQLSDGLAFDILEEVAIECAIIYTTAYDQYAIQAFKTTGIDYLLKPITAHELSRALLKFQKNQNKNQGDQLFNSLELLLEKQNSNKHYKQQFLLKSGHYLEPVSVHEIAYFYRDELVFARSFAEKKYIMDESLNFLQTQLDPSQFFRLNRQLLVNKVAIQKLLPTKPGRLQIEVRPHFQTEIHLSQERSSWLKTMLGM
ncbi:MAG: LytTR family DNA-binding domain-containing protein [Saprospiraceae bacterium]